MKVYVAQFNPVIGDIEGNQSKIIRLTHKAIDASADIVIFPELAITGYPPEDFLLLPHFLHSIEEAIKAIAAVTYGITSIIGTPRVNRSKIGKPLYNSAVVIHDGTVIGYQDKVLLPTYDVFDERRYFEPGSQMVSWRIKGKMVAITICEDIWEHGEQLTLESYSRDPIKELLSTSQRPNYLLNLSASPYSVGKAQSRMLSLQKAAKVLGCPAVLCNQVGANDSLIFDGRSIAVDRKGKLVMRGRAFHEDDFLVDLDNLHAAELSLLGDVLEDLHDALVLGIRDYFHKQGFTKACLGLSGGIDSALVAYLGAAALGKENILGVAMPSPFSSAESVEDARVLADNLEIEFIKVPIESVYNEYNEVLRPVFGNRPFDVTEENIQARIRGMLLMAISNKLGYIILNTGNKSELAVGYSTLYGDMCGGLAVLADVSKRRVYALAEWINRDREIIPRRTIDKPPSAELRPGQKDSDSLPPYEILDVIIEQYLEKHRPPEEISRHYHIPLPLILDIIPKIHAAEYKRRQSPPGLRITDRAFSTGRRFPIVQGWE